MFTHASFIAAEKGFLKREQKITINECSLNFTYLLFYKCILITKHSTNVIHPTFTYSNQYFASCTNVIHFIEYGNKYKSILPLHALFTFISRCIYMLSIIYSSNFFYLFIQSFFFIIQSSLLVVLIKTILG